MANLSYFKKKDVNEDDKFLTVGKLMDILKNINPETKVFLRNLDEWGNKIVIKDGFGYSEVSDGLIENVVKTNINQTNNEAEYIILQGCISKSGFDTLDEEPYQKVIYHHTWLDKYLKKITPTETMVQLKTKFLNVERNCGNCYNLQDNHCSISKLEVKNKDSCELWQYENNERRI